MTLNVSVNLSALREAKWHQFALRFFFGGSISVLAGVIAEKYGPGVGGLFLAFPAIFPASATAPAQAQALDRTKFFSCQRFAPEMIRSKCAPRSLFLERPEREQKLQPEIAHKIWLGGSCRLQTTPGHQKQDYRRMYLVAQPVFQRFAVGGGMECSGGVKFRVHFQILRKFVAHNKPGQPSRGPR